MQVLRYNTRNAKTAKKLLKHKWQTPQASRQNLVLKNHVSVIHVDPPVIDLAVQTDTQ